MKALAFLIKLALVVSLRATLLDLSVTQSLIHIEGAAGPNSYSQTQSSGELFCETAYDDPVPDEFGVIRHYVSYAYALQTFTVGNGLLWVEAGVSVYGSSSESGPFDAYGSAKTTLEGTLHIAVPTIFTIEYDTQVHDDGSVFFFDFPPILTSMDRLWSLSASDLFGEQPPSELMYGSSSGILLPGDYQLRLYSEGASLNSNPTSEWYRFGLSTRALADRVQTVLLFALGLAGIMVTAAGASWRSSLKGSSACLLVRSGRSHGGTGKHA